MDEAAAVGVEPVFLRRSAGEVLFALVNVEQPVRRVPVSVRLPGDARATDVEVIDPASPEAAIPIEHWSEADDGQIGLELTELGEFGVAVVSMTFREPS